MVESLLVSLREALQSQVGAGMVALSLVGAVIAFGRSLPGRFLRLLERQMVVSVDVPHSSEVFGWLCGYLDQHPYSRTARRLTASAVGSCGGSGRRDDETRVLYTPAPGNHLLWVHGRPLWLNRERKEMPGQGGGWPTFQETFTLRMLGRSAEAFRKLFDEAHQLATAEERRVAIYASVYGDWSRLREKRPRSLSSVSLRAGLADDITADLSAFLAREEWYLERGIPWRRGVLLEGPPGTGKTSLITALAGVLDLDLYMLSIADKGLTDQGLVSLLLRVPPRSIVLLEDIDRIVDGDEIKGDGVTMAGLLNAFDGVASQTGIITFITANHPEKIPAALRRDGRIDRTWTLGPATEEQAERFFLHFYGGDPALAAEARTFGQAAAGRVPAELQGVCLRHPDDPAGAVAALSPPSLALAS
jgi:hypothetical protein